MSEQETPTHKPENPRSSELSNGPSLALIYGLLGLMFLAAMAIAGFIVLPFYHRH
ncbi:MAG TPA: hypothetical protein VK716_15315 [Terracidiphilus sp.]|jgi:hypothetical protein|nr:hypothetical protein [Terracidiphilus sp.]